MLKSLYTRIVLTYIGAVLISLVISMAVAILLFQETSYENTEEVLREKADHISQLYVLSQPEDWRVFLETVAQLSAVRMQVISPNTTQSLRYNWPSEDSFCDCTAAVRTPIVIDGQRYELVLSQQSEGNSGIEEIAIILVIVLLIGGLLMLFSARRLVKPIKNLTTAARQIATGNFSVRLSETRRDELGALSSAINHMAEEIGQLDRERQEFVANVSHEFQSPLTVIKGFSSMLLEGTLDELEQRRSLQIMIEESEGLSKLSDNLLRLASLESGRYSYQSAKFDLAEQIRRTVLTLEPLWSDRRLDVELIANRTMVSADEELLAQVWTNLMSNAIKFTPEGGTIRIVLQADDVEVEIRFYDNGIAIPAQDQERIFERFYKVDRARDRKTEGSGLGLSIVRKIIDIHRGTIELRQGDENVKCFLVRIPNLTVAASDSPDIEIEFVLTHLK